MTAESITLTEKYERNGWPSLARPDVKPPTGWSLSLITAVSRVRNHTLSPTGNQIAFIWDRDDLSDVYTLPATGGWPARHSTERKLAAYWADETPQWSPDGQSLAFCLDGHVHITQASGGLPQKISDFAPSAFSPVWMPDNQSLVVSVERQESIQLLLTDRNGRWPRPLVTASDSDAWDAQPAPNGRFLLYTRRPFNDLNRLDIWRVDLETGQTHPLTGSSKTKDWSARWSPDSNTIIFLSQRGGWNDLWLMAADGSQPRQLTRLGKDIGEFAWSPDGKQLACTINDGGAYHLALLHINSGELTYLQKRAGFFSHLNWSPVGDFLTVEYEDAFLPPDVYRVSCENGRLTQLTFSNLPALAKNTLIEPEQISYKSQDGLEIPAFLYQPTRPNGAAILYPHGGPSAQYGYEWDILAQYFVAKGYTWLAVNYRGSTGYGVPFEQANYGNWGVGDTQDCLAGARFLHQLDWIDPQRIAIYGPSYGGYMVACCLSYDPEYLFACGVSKYGDANPLTSWAQCNRDLRLYTEIFLGHPSQNRQVYRNASPIHQVNQVQKPVLILHGLLDDVVPPEASEEWVEQLRQANKTFEYKTYTGEPHGFLQRKTQQDAYRRMERFLDWYLLPGRGI